MAPTPGILYVTMQPKPELPIAQFHDWYNNEHGPGRLRLPFFPNGFRYRATDLSNEPGSKEKPEWMAIYDVTDMDYLTQDVYTRLRQPPVQSQRERETMKQIHVDRRFYDLVDSHASPAFDKLEAVQREGSGNVLVAASVRVHPGQAAELDRWMKDEHVPMLSQVPGWRRTRRFVTSSLEHKSEAETEHLALHEYAPENGLGGPEFQAATNTKWRDEVFTSVVKEKRRRVYDLYYTFGPAPRDLSSLCSPAAVPFTSPDGKTTSFPSAQRPAIESFVTTPDGVELPYRLEGSPDPAAPLVVLSNSILVTWGIWDGFLSSFFADPHNRKYRVLRYLTRGRRAACGDRPVTVDALGDDVVTLLDALRVRKAAAVIGVSLGGATALNVGLRYPERTSGFVACDTSAKSPEGNRKAWGERIEVAEGEGARSEGGEEVVGERLAEMTVRRWFVGGSYDGGEVQARVERVKEMVRTNSLEGFRRSVRALWEYDMTPLMRECRVRGAFVVGGGDGVLPKSMKSMAEGLGERAELRVIEDAGHLPMVEKPEEFAEFVTKFLAE